MSEASQPSSGFGGLTPWDEFVDKHFPLPDGRKRGRRSRQKIARECGFHLIRIARHNFVDEQYEADRLREISQRDMLPRGPGRPRKQHSAAVDKSEKTRRARASKRDSDAAEAQTIVAASADDGSQKG
jgi:hypothetical protein